MRPTTAFLTLAAAVVLVAACFIGPASAAEKRLALVIGNSAYQASPLATAANDAGLVAQTLQAAGFDVIGARDLDEDALRKSLRDFIEKASAAGPDAVTFVYLAGLGLQLEGENYFAPVDLRVSSAADVSLRALRISDYTKSLAALPLKARFFVLDGARRSPFVVADKPLAGGLALTEAEPGSLIAFNAAPGTVGPVEKGPYGAYAQALVEMIREGGLQPGPLFDRVRLRVDAATKGAEVPFDADRTGASFLFFDRAPDAPALGRERVAALRERPLRDLGAQDAYAVCLERDDLAHYQQFVSDYPNDLLARRVRALIAARREAIVWRRTWLVGTPDAYWSYLSRYPRGPHAWDARRRLSSLAAAMEPPPRYVALVYDVPPPPPEEIVYVDRPVIYLDDPIFALPPPPPPALVFLPPPPAYLVALAPPPPVYGVYALPTPPIVAVPTYVSAPAYVAPPPNNVIFQNIHNTTVIEQINRQNTIVQAPPSGAAVGTGAVAGAALGAAAARVALPAALQQRAALAASPPQAGGMARQGASQAVPLAAAPQPGLPTAPGQPPGGRALPGASVSGGCSARQHDDPAHDGRDCPPGRGSTTVACPNLTSAGCPAPAAGLDGASRTVWSAARPAGGVRGPAACLRSGAASAAVATGDAKAAVGRGPATIPGTAATARHAPSANDASPSNDGPAAGGTSAACSASRRRTAPAAGRRRASLPAGPPLPLSSRNRPPRPFTGPGGRPALQRRGTGRG